MDITRIEGCTRVIGEAQGYIGLPLRDISIVDAEGETPAMESAWLPSDAEKVAIAAGSPIVLRVLGRGHPPVALYVGDPAIGRLTDAARDVLNERARQLQVEGFTAEHDDRHSRGELAIAAADYALLAGRYGYLGAPAYRASATPVHNGDGQPLWPWAYEWFKPKDPRADLVKAAALILAEIERLDREAMA